MSRDYPYAFPRTSGYIYYNNLGTVGNTDYWSTIKSRALDYFDNISFPTYDNIEVGAYLTKMGEIERKKELRVLENFYGTSLGNISSIESSSDILLAMNKAFNLETVFERVVSRVVNNSQELQNRSTNIAANYGSYVSKHLLANVGRYTDSGNLQELIMKGNFKKIAEDWNELANKALDSALNEMLGAHSSNKRKDRETDPDNRPWLELKSAVDEIKSFRQEFKTDFYSRYGFDKIERLIEFQWEDIKNKLTAGITSDNIKSLVKTNFQQSFRGDLSQSISGYVAEHLSILINQVAGKKSGLTLSAKRTNSSASIDVVTGLGDIGLEIDLEFDTQSARNKVEVAQEFSRFYKQMKDGHKRGALVYESTKKYHLGDTFRGFKGTTFSVDSAVGLLNSIGFNDAERFLYKIKQTLPGGLLPNSLRAEASKILAQYIAYFMFDDWETIGTDSGGVDVIHVFRLSDIVVPLSWLLLKMGKAIELASRDADRYVQVHFTDLKNLYPRYSEAEPEGHSRIDSIRRWNEQRSAGNSMKLQIHFLNHFKELIAGELGYLFKI